MTAPRVTGARAPNSANCKAAMIVHDPLDIGALPAGLWLSADELYHMRHKHAFTPGTTLRIDKQLWRVGQTGSLEKIP